MVRIIDNVAGEGKKIAQSAKNVGPWKDTGGVNAARIGFKEGSTTSKMSVLGGVVTGVTMTLQGIRNIKKGLVKDANGKRDLATAFVGAAETAGGAFVTGLFYERLKLENTCDTGREQ